MTSREAARERMRQRRAGVPGARERDRWWVRTRYAALQQLCEEHPQRFAEILQEIRRDSPGPWERGT